MLVATVAAYTSLGVLLFAGMSHLGTLERFGDQLRRQRAWPASITPVLAAVVALLELAIGGLGGVALLGASPSSRLLAAALSLAAAQYGAYGLYLLWLHHAAEDPVPCACSSRTVPVSGWSVGRALALSATSLIAAVTAGSVVAVTELSGVMAALAATPIGIGLWILPEALADPSTLPATTTVVQR